MGKGFPGIVSDLTDTWKCMLEQNGDARTTLWISYLGASFLTALSNLDTPHRKSAHAHEPSQSPPGSGGRCGALSLFPVRSYPTGLTPVLVGCDRSGAQDGRPASQVPFHIVPASNQVWSDLDRYSEDILDDPLDPERWRGRML